MKTILIILSFLGLVLTVFPAFFVFSGESLPWRPTPISCPRAWCCGS